MTMGTIITNAILLEYTFSIPGMFSLMTQALGNADLPVIEGVAIAGALLVALANLMADFVHAWLDPRVRGDGLRPGTGLAAGLNSITEGEERPLRGARPGTPPLGAVTDFTRGPAVVKARTARSERRPPPVAPAPGPLPLG